MYRFEDGAENVAIVPQSPNDSSSFLTISPKSMAFCNTDLYGVVQGTSNPGMWHVYADDTGAILKDVLYTPEQIRTIAEKHCDKE